MNGFLNLFFIILLFTTLIGVDYLFSITDILTARTYDVLNTNNFSNYITDMGYAYYQNIRGLLYSGITGVLTPFLIFLSFASSFINRNQDIISYTIFGLMVCVLTPLSIYLFAEVFTQLLNVSILDSAYMATAYFDNFTYIMVANMLLTLSSFVFLQKKQPVGI